MVKQKPISAKIDTLNYAWLCQEASVSGLPKNRIINKAIAMYIRTMDARRRLRCTPHSREEVEKMAAAILGIESFELFS